ncbi:MAG TPA: protein kinase, partial [Gemmatimonadales bacterium]
MRVRLKRDELVRIVAASSLSQNHWAIKLGFSRGHWSEIVNGKHPFPSPLTRERMLEVFGVPFDALFAIEEGAVPDTELEFKQAIRHRYSLIRELAQGGMGTVYLAMDVQHGRQVALKVMSTEAIGGIGAAELLKEIALVARLQHPNILPLFDSGEAAEQPWYVMPWIRDGSLRNLLSSEGRLTAGQVVSLISPIAAALEHAHGEQVLHCDIKPENVLLHGRHPYVMDFGIARKLHSESREWAGLRRELDFSAGTPAYVSPEQANGDPDLDVRSDVYSLACVTYEMLAGRPPFQGTTTREIVTRRFRAPAPDLREWAPEVPRPVVDLLQRAMSLERGQRPSSATEYAVALAEAARGGSGRMAQARVGASRLLDRMSRGMGLQPSQPLGSALSGMGKDLTLAWRGLRRAPGFALVVILTLGLALGANATMFGVADRLLLRPPAGIGHPEQVRRVLVARWINGLGDPRVSLSYPHFEDYRDRTRSFSQVAAMDQVVYSYGIGPSARPVNAALVTGQYFALLEVPAFLGRYFGEPEDQAPAGTPVAVLSHAFWRSAFGGDSAVLGRTIPLGSQRFTVIGVTPRGFNGTELSPVDLWLPMSTLTLGVFGETTWRTDRDSQWLQVFARLRPGVTDGAAESDATHAYRATHLDDRGEFHRLAVTRLGTLVAGANPMARDRTGRVSAWLLGVAAILLVIGCANIANLMLARGLMRRGEFAVRLALGVSRGRLLRQLLTESLLLAGLGALVGITVLAWGTDLIRAVLLPGTAWDEGTLNPRVLIVTLGTTLLAALAAGLFPLLRATRVDVATQLHGGPRATAAHARRLRGTLLLVQTSLSTALLIGAGLFLRSIRAVNALDLGFEPRAVSAVSVDL